MAGLQGRKYYLFHQMICDDGEIDSSGINSEIAGSHDDSIIKKEKVKGCE